MAKRPDSERVFLEDPEWRRQRQRRWLRATSWRLARDFESPDAGDPLRRRGRVVDAQRACRARSSLPSVAAAPRRPRQLPAAGAPVPQGHRPVAERCCGNEVEVARLPLRSPEGPTVWRREVGVGKCGGQAVDRPRNRGNPAGRWWPGADLPHAVAL